MRKESFEKLYESYAGVKNTIASLYGSILKYDSINAKLRGYTSSLESYLNPNNIPTALYNNLIKTINDNLEPLYEYFELKKKMLGLDEFHLYDGYVSTIKSIDKKYSYEEAKSIVLDALKIYNDEYIEKLVKLLIMVGLIYIQIKAKNQELIQLVRMIPCLMYY